MKSFYIMDCATATLTTSLKALPLPLTFLLSNLALPIFLEKGIRNERYGTYKASSQIIENLFHPNHHHCITKEERWFIYTFSAFCVDKMCVAVVAV